MYLLPLPLADTNVSGSVLGFCVLPAGRASSSLECVSIRTSQRFATLVGVCVLAHGIGRLFFLGTGWAVISLSFVMQKIRNSALSESMFLAFVNISSTGLVCSVSAPSDAIEQMFAVVRPPLPVSIAFAAGAKVVANRLFFSGIVFYVSQGSLFGKTSAAHRNRQQHS